MHRRELDPSKGGEAPEAQPSFPGSARKGGRRNQPSRAPLSSKEAKQLGSFRASCEQSGGSGALGGAGVSRGSRGRCAHSPNFFGSALDRGANGLFWSKTALRTRVGFGVSRKFWDAALAKPVKLLQPEASEMRVELSPQAQPGDVPLLSG